MWRRVAICFSFGILCLVQGWALPSTTPAQGRVDSSGGRATGLPDIPEACKTPRMRPEAPAEVPRNEVESQGLSAEAYESLGTFYGREGQFSCAIAAFQAALARSPILSRRTTHLGGPFKIWGSSSRPATNSRKR